MQWIWRMTMDQTVHRRWTRLYTDDGPACTPTMDQPVHLWEEAAQSAAVSDWPASNLKKKLIDAGCSNNLGKIITIFLNFPELMGSQKDR